MKEIFIWVLGIVVTLALIWILAINGLLLNGYVAPRQEAIRRETFEQSKSYNQGMTQELQNMQFEYIKATPEQKITMRSVILHRTADYPKENLPTDLQQFIEELQNEIK